MPLVLRRVIEAMYPRRDSSAATKYSPDTPTRIEGRSPSADTFLAMCLCNPTMFRPIRLTPQTRFGVPYKTPANAGAVRPSS